MFKNYIKNCDTKYRRIRPSEQKQWSAKKYKFTYYIYVFLLLICLNCRYVHDLIKTALWNFALNNIPLTTSRGGNRFWNWSSQWDNRICGKFIVWFFGTLSPKKKTCEKEHSHRRARSGTFQLKIIGVCPIVLFCIFYFSPHRRLNSQKPQFPLLFCFSIFHTLNLWREF